MDTLRSVNDVTEISTQEAHMGAPLDKMVWIFGEVSFKENDVCFLGASYFVLLIALKLSSNSGR